VFVALKQCAFTDLSLDNCTY